MKVKITTQRAILLVLILLFLSLFILLYKNLPSQVYSAEYHGVRMNFRVNLKEAKNVPVYPSEYAIKMEIMNPYVENITIAFIPGSGQQNAHYAVETFEITNKLATAFLVSSGYLPNFNVINVTSYQNLTGKIQNPIIALVHPFYSNETSVRLENHVVFIAGKNATSSSEQLRNFDLATVKFLISVLGIEV